MGEENVQEDWKGSGTGKWAQLSFIFLNLLSQVVITLGDVIFYDKEQQNLLAETLILRILYIWTYLALNRKRLFISQEIRIDSNINNLKAGCMHLCSLLPSRFQIGISLTS